MHKEELRGELLWRADSDTPPLHRLGCTSVSGVGVFLGKVIPKAGVGLLWGNGWEVGRRSGVKRAGVSNWRD